MEKFKNYKILIFLLVFTFTAQLAWADPGDVEPPKYSYYVAYNKVKVNKTGAGLVYTQQGTSNFDTNFNSKKAEVFRNSSKSNDSNSAVCTEIVDKKSARFTFYMQAEEKEGYKFVHWENEEGEIVSSQKYCSVNVITTNYCGEYTEAESKNTTIWHNPQDNNPDYYDALYTAVFEPLVKDPLIKVSSNNTNLGMTTITHEDNSNAVENDIGDDVVLFAYTLNYDKKFIGWQKNGGTEIIGRENPWHLHVSEENAGEYTAVFEDGYKFCRMKNFGAEHRFVTAINDEGSLNDLTAIKLESSFDDVIANAGSVIEIYTDTKYVPIPDGEGTKKVTYYDFIVQNSSGVDKDYYDFSGGAYLRMPHYTRFADEGTWAFSQADITYNDEGEKTGYRFRDNNGQASFNSFTNDLYSQWYIEPIDKDLETCENYFSLDPAKLVQVGDKYYTTLRTSWNILFNPEQMTPYVVTSVDEETGTFEMEPITGNIIPLGTPVIIETKSVSVEENRMVPTTTAFTGTKPATNLLTTSEKYFPNQSVSGNYKALMVNGEGQLAFGGDALTTVNGNEAYLQVANDVALKPIADLPTLATLKAIESTGDKGKLYTVEDGLVAVAFAVDEQEECALLWCKDQAESNAKTEVKTGQTDYMKNQYAKLYNSPAPEKWDQSNWVAVKLVPYMNVGLSDIATRLKNDVVGHVLKPKAVTGTYSDDVNYTIAMAMPEQEGKVIFENMIGDAFTNNENLYCTANFLSENLVGENGDTQKHYYFVNPKIQEVAEVTFAVWNGSYFVAPAPQEGTSTNESEINGAFNVDWRYNSHDINTLASNKAYQFMAVVQKPVAVAGGMGLKEESEVTPMSCTPDGTYMVFPLNLDPSNKDQVITSIAQPVVSKTVSRVMYYNLMGVASAVPFQGVNIVVTEYSDGSRQARKVVMK